MARGRRATWIAASVVGAVALIAVGALARAWPSLFPSTLEQGRSAYARREWSRAALLAMKRLKDEPDDRDALRLLARSSGRMGQDQAAWSTYQRLGLDDLGAEDDLIIAAGLHRQNDLGSAYKFLEKGYELAPDHPEILHDLSRFSASMGRLNRAEGLAERLARLPDQGARGEVLLGAIRDRLSDPAGATEALERALRISPTLEGLEPALPEARKILARNYLNLGDFAHARDHLLKILGAGADPEVAWLLGRSRLQEGRPGDDAFDLKQAARYRADHPMVPDPSPFVGSSSCAGCHQDIHRAQQASRHARTFLGGPDLAKLPMPAAEIPDPADPKGVGHWVRRDGDRVEWESRAGGRTARAIIRYAFGSGDRGVTPVGLDESGRFREIRLSRYGQVDGWDLTTGHASGPGPSTADEALGTILGDDDLRGCLSCHTTDYLSSSERRGPTAKETGIGCERCHGPGGNHLKAVAFELPDPAIARPKLASAEQVTRLCAGCHSPSNRTLQPGDPDAVRFQGSTLTWSRCYQESRGRMSCVTCHDPHHDAGRSAPIYEAKCLSCHSAAPDTPARESGGLPVPTGGRGAACPVNPRADCLKCHMPSTSSVVPHTTFTDHQIRIHRAEDRASPGPPLKEPASPGGGPVPR